MDTSIIVVIAIIVVFVVVVPTMIRKSATELSRVEIDTVPDRAQVIDADPQIPGHDHTERARVFHSSATIEPTVPRPDVAPMAGTPKLSLSAQAPEFGVIDGHADSSSTTDTESTTAEADEQHQRSFLPVAVGETRSTYLDSHRGHEASASATSDNVRMLHPAVHAVFNQSQQGSNGHSANGQGSSASRSSGSGSPLGERSGTVPLRPGRTQPRSPQSRSDEAVTTDTTETSRRGTQIPNPTFGADEDHSMTEKATTLRESMKSLGTMTRGFALLFLASTLGILVTGVLAMFSVVHVALVGVFLGLAIVSLAIVRTLNLRKREIKARLRELESRNPKTKRTAPKKSTTSTTSTTRSTSAAAKPAAASAPASPTAAASKSPTAAASKSPDSKPGEARSAGSTKAARARAVMQRNVSAKQSREEADTGEIPLVRIRNEAAEGHTTRQVLLTGPIPIVEEAAPDAAEAQGEEAAPAGSDSVSMSTAPESASMIKADDSALTATSTREAEPAAESKSAPRNESAAENDSAEESEVVATASNVDTVEVSDPFMQRLQARAAWSPTPLPVPSYVDAPQVEHPVPEAKAADASSYSSYETKARSREDIAAQFAAELGYRPELSDSARDDSPLEHGRKAIRTNKAPEMGAVDDVLARRRA
ncbi:hypothetical protein GCM10009689_09010 [Brevibacterium antiquum]|uniref:hypothetical protein n=1 Tax=Brevibacterium antiquum TaxID=234835 RepID=UPI0018DF51AD|nr:hypothetical protein [Brevibacterium antiquum]